MKRSDLLWEIVCYVGLALCIFGQIAIGQWYLVAQFAYLIANATAFVRSVVIGLPMANRVRDLTFLVITATLIILRIMGIM